MIELQRTLFDGHKHSHGRQQLGHTGQFKNSAAITVGVPTAIVGTRGSRDRVDWPLVNLR
ncbi:hypothetical protein JCM7447_14880 [Corynebacterium amycolatum]